MSGFFAGLNTDIRFTDSRINGGGPLPDDVRGGPAGSDGTAEGKYNATSELLAGITPYALAGQGSLNSGRIMQTAHRVAMCIPGVMLPEPAVDAENTFVVHHAVDMGDVAFVVRPSPTRMYSWLSAKPYAAQNPKHAHALVNVNVFLNIVQVNYVLAGITNRLHHLWIERRQMESARNSWDMLIVSFGAHVKKIASHIIECPKENYCFFVKTYMLLQHILHFHIMPFGICAGSENQGGQHEARDKPVQAATSHFTTMTVDGQNRDLVNIWRNVDIDGGDQLIIHLAPTQRSNTVQYVLNHWPKGTVTKLMKFDPRLCGCALQLVPSYYQSGDLTRHHSQKQEFDFVMQQLARQPYTRDVLDYLFDYRVMGYWHCGQTHTKASKFCLAAAPSNDTQYLSGGLLQVNWAPVWKSGGMLEWYKTDRYQRLKHTYQEGVPWYVPRYVPHSDILILLLQVFDTGIDGASYKGGSDSIEGSQQLRAQFVLPTSRKRARTSRGISGKQHAQLAVQTATAPAPETEVGAAKTSAKLDVVGPLVAEQEKSVAENAKSPAGRADSLPLATGLVSETPMPDKTEAEARSKSRAQSKRVMPKISFLEEERIQETPEEMELQRIFAQSKPQ